MSLFNQFSALEAREIHKQVVPIQTSCRNAELPVDSSKILLPLNCYVFQDGPWRDTLIRFSYDPRKDVQARLFVFPLLGTYIVIYPLISFSSYQRLYFRNANHPIARPSVIARRQDRTAANTQNRTVDGSEQDADRRLVHYSPPFRRRVLLIFSNIRRSHIFDGKTVTKETAAFQLCDIVDPMLKEMIEDPNNMRDTCDVSLPVPFIFQILTLSPCDLNRNATDGTRRMPSSVLRPSFGTSSSLSWKDTPRQTTTAWPSYGLTRVQPSL